VRHYWIHAGLYLLAKEFRYIMTLRNKAAIYNPLGRKLVKPSSLCLVVLSTNQTIYVFIQLHSLVFLINSCEPQLYDNAYSFCTRLSFSRSYRNNLPSSISLFHFYALIIFINLPVSGLVRMMIVVSGKWSFPEKLLAL